MTPEEYETRKILPTHAYFCTFCKAEFFDEELNMNMRHTCGEFAVIKDWLIENNNDAHRSL